MTKLTRSDFIGLLESGKYNKITGDLYGRAIMDNKGGGRKESVCAIGAALKETGNVNKNPAPGFSYLPQQLVDDLQITPEVERKIFTTNDTTGQDNWKAVIAMLRKEWNISESIAIDYYKTEELLNSYFTEYYKVEDTKEEIYVEKFGY